MIESKFFVLIPNNLHSYDWHLDKDGYVYGMFFTHSLVRTTRSIHVRKIVYEYLKVNGFDYKGGFFNTGPVLSFKIGGQNSGFISKMSLSSLLWSTVYEEMNEKIRKISRNDFNFARMYTVSNKVFKKYFPNLPASRNPFRRTPLNKYGREDDAMIVNEMLWERLVNPLLKRYIKNNKKSPIEQMLESKLLVLGNLYLPYHNEEKLKKAIVEKYWIVLISAVRNYLYSYGK